MHADILRQDLRYAARTLARSPGFALTAILVLALGVGANTAAFSVTDFVLIRPLPFAEPDRLVKLWETATRLSAHGAFSAANYRDWKRMSRSFESMGAFTASSVNLVGQGDPERLEGVGRHRRFASAAGRAAADGAPVHRRQRTALARPERCSELPVVAIGVRRRAGVIGRSINLDNEPYTVIGVMPRDFHFPSSRG